MDLLHCVNSTQPVKTPRGNFVKTRQVHSEERDVRQNQVTFGTQRRISLPAGHYAASPGSKSRAMSPTKSDKPEFRHYGSSLSLSNRGNSVASELTSRTLRPPSPTLLRKISTMSTASTSSTSSTSSTKSSRPPLPNLKVELDPPKLADYLARPRLVSTLTLNCKGHAPNSERPTKQHLNFSKDVSNYRNLRLGNFMEMPEGEDDELIPERLRQYYLETYLNVCETCDALTHSHPNATLHRGM